MAYAIYVLIINKFMAYVNNFANFSFDEAKIIMSPVFFNQVTSFGRNQSRTSKHLTFEKNRASAACSGYSFLK